LHKEEKEGQKRRNRHCSTGVAEHDQQASIVNEIEVSYDIVGHPSQGLATACRRWAPIRVFSRPCFVSYLMVLFKDILGGS